MIKNYIFYIRCTSVGTTDGDVRMNILEISVWLSASKGLKNDVEDYSS